MTERIFERQREADTLSGYLRQLEHQALIRQHHAAQRLLEPLAVINPYAPQLNFPAHSLRARRDHKKYLMLIKAIAFLHQQQRPVKEYLHGDQVLRYIEVTRADIRAANEIAQSVLVQSASELSAPARTLLTYIHAHVKEHCAVQKLSILTSTPSIARPCATASVGVTGRCACISGVGATGIPQGP